jgi:hypothetical protein
MARTRKPTDETTEQIDNRRRMEAVSNQATRSEKVAWDRRMDNMVKVLARLRPIEDAIVEQMILKNAILDEVAETRKDMVRDCVHPITHLVHGDDKTVTCKFCNRRFARMVDNGE